MKILCLDFDGVIHSYTSGWQGIDCIPDPPVPGSFEFIIEASEYYRVNIFSTRTAGEPIGKVAVKKWFTKWCLPTNILDKLAFPDNKPKAHLTIDDRAWCFKGKFPSIKEIQDFKPWNKR
jgi:hypothetical protein